MKEINVSILLGKTLTGIAEFEEKDYYHRRGLKFTVNDSEEYLMYHEQNCCECVYIEDINGDLQNLVGSPLLMAEVATNEDPPPEGMGDGSHLWTFYKFATVKGYVTIRWYGESNGYYSVGVSFGRAKENHDDG